MKGRAVNYLEWCPDFGVFHINVREAAELVVLDMWQSGWIQDIDEPEEWDGSQGDCEVLAMLEEDVAVFEARLLAAVDSGRLKAAVLRRDFHERIVSGDTYVSYGDLDDWLHGRGYGQEDHNDAISEWLDNEADIVEKVIQEVAYLRAAKRAGRLRETISGDPDAAYKATILENQRLKDLLANPKADQQAKVDRPLRIRQRRTLLTVIAALCQSHKLDSQGRGTAQRIMEMTDAIGAHVDDGTIANLLREIPDALESRKK